MKQDTVVRSEQSKEKQQAGQWTGAVMILVGVIFLMGTSGITILGYNPWMLFALVPVYSIGAAAYKRYKEAGLFQSRQSDQRSRDFQSRLLWWHQSAIRKSRLHS